LRQIELAKALTYQIDKAKKRDPSDSKAVELLALEMYSEWKKLVNRVLEKAKKVSHTEKAIDKFLKETDKIMGEFQGLVEDDIIQTIEYTGKYNKKRFIEKNKLIVKFSKERPKVVRKVNLPELEALYWFARDEAAIEAISQMEVTAAGGFYAGSSQQAVWDSVKKNVFERGLTRAEAGKAMQKDLSKALRITKGKLESKVVPKGFSGTADQYFKGLSQHGATMSRTASTVYALDDTGSKYIVIRAKNTNRTCLGCASMDGTKYKTKDAVNQMQKLLSAESIADLKLIQPSFHFQTPDKYKPESLKEQKIKADAVAKEAANNYALPSFHFRCECYVDRG